MAIPRKLRMQKRARIILWLVCCALLNEALEGSGVIATECFPKSQAKLSHILTAEGATSDNKEEYDAITGCDKYIIAGGHSGNEALKYSTGDTNGFSVLTRIDLDTFSVRWSRTYGVSTPSTTKYIVALTLHQSASIDRIAVFAQNYE